MLSLDASVDSSSASAASISGTVSMIKLRRRLQFARPRQCNRDRACATDCDCAYRSPKLHAMAADRIELRYHTHDGPRTLSLLIDGKRVEQDGVSLSAHLESRDGRSIAYAVISNR